MREEINRVFENKQAADELGRAIARGWLVKKYKFVPNVKMYQVTVAHEGYQRAGLMLAPTPGLAQQQASEFIKMIERMI